MQKSGRYSVLDRIRPKLLLLVQFSIWIAIGNGWRSKGKENMNSNLDDLAESSKFRGSTASNKEYFMIFFHINLYKILPRNLLDPSNFG